MDDDASGVDLLRHAVDDVAATLPRARPAQPGRAALRVGVAAAALLAVAGAWTIARRAGDGPGVARRESVAPAEGKVLGIDVLVLKIHGRDVSPRVFEATAAGTIVVAPVVQHPSSKATAAMILSAAGRRP